MMTSLILSSLNLCRLFSALWLELAWKAEGSDVIYLFRILQWASHFVKLLLSGSLKVSMFLSPLTCQTEIIAPSFLKHFLSLRTPSFPDSLSNFQALLLIPSPLWALFRSCLCSTHCLECKAIQPQDLKYYLLRLLKFVSSASIYSLNFKSV